MPHETPFGPLLDPLELLELADGATERECGDLCPGRTMTRCGSCFGTRRHVSPEGVRRFAEMMPLVVRSLAVFAGGDVIREHRERQAREAEEARVAREAAAAAEAAAAEAEETAAALAVVAELAPGAVAELPARTSPELPKRKWVKGVGLVNITHDEGEAPSGETPPEGDERAHE